MLPPEVALEPGGSARKDRIMSGRLKLLTEQTTRPTAHFAHLDELQ